MKRLRAEPGRASARMSRQARHDTGPELALRSELHRHGLRYRTHRRPVHGVRREADVVFSQARVAVFVDGCFWHGCPQHGTQPKRNATFWDEKILLNQVRDAETDSLLRAACWLPIRVWEHELAADAADRIEAIVRERSAGEVDLGGGPQPGFQN
jgi:DNA mismatch endonuclease, patch repair protein